MNTPAWSAAHEKELEWACKQLHLIQSAQGLVCRASTAFGLPKNQCKQCSAQPGLLHTHSSNLHTSRSGGAPRCWSLGTLRSTWIKAGVRMRHTMARIEHAGCQEAPAARQQRSL